MSENTNSYETLGLNDASSFEEVQAARERLLIECEGDPQRKAKIEAAYDTILMERLRMRQEGKIKVPDRIRFAEKQAEVTVSAAKEKATPMQSPAWLQDWLDTPSRDDILWPSLIFLGLAITSWFLGTAEESSLSVTLGFGVAICVYFVNRKERRFWRSILLAGGGLIAGLLLGFVVGVLLTQQGVAVAGGGLAAIATILTCIVLWFVSCFLR
jgi:hypothetical protein